MGRATRWLRGLFGGKKPDSSNRGGGATPEKKRWGFGKSFREKEKAQKGEPPPAPPAVRVRAAARVTGERKGSYREVVGADEDEQNKRAIAVAAATAAVAEAAVAAAHAAAAVVRLTSSRRCVAGKREEYAAVKIQSAFRGYLARRALKALRGLVKLQALVRGNIVRKQAAETLRCMHALVRVQARARACRALRSERCRSDLNQRANPGPPTPEKYEQTAQSTGSKSSRSSPLKRNSTKSMGSGGKIDRERTHSSSRNWLDQWIEEKYWDDDKNAKILEIDPGKPKYINNSKRRTGPHFASSCSTLTSDQNSRSFATVPDSPSKDSTTAQLSVLSPSSVEINQSQPLDSLRSPVETPVLGESPQFYSATSRVASSRQSPFTPAKSECSFGGYSDYPNYMANTKSSRAKVRSQSAPKQRPEYDKSGSVRRPSGHGVSTGQKSSSLSSSLHAKFANKAYPGSGRLDRLGMPLRY